MIKPSWLEYFCQVSKECVRHIFRRKVFPLLDLTKEKVFVALRVKYRTLEKSERRKDEWKNLGDFSDPWGAKADGDFESWSDSLTIWSKVFEKERTQFWKWSKNMSLSSHLFCLPLVHYSTSFHHNYAIKRNETSFGRSIFLGFLFVFPRVQSLVLQTQFPTLPHFLLPSIA